MPFLLLIIAWALKAILSPVLFIYGIVRATWLGAVNGYDVHGFWGIFAGAWMMLEWWFGEMAIAIDQFGNVLGSFLFNDALIRDKVDEEVTIVKAYRAGDRLFTISYFLGRNADTGTLSKAGRAFVEVLDELDEDHVRRAHIKGHRRIFKTAFELDPHIPCQDLSKQVQSQ